MMLKSQPDERREDDEVPVSKQNQISQFLDVLAAILNRLIREKARSLGSPKRSGGDEAERESQREVR
jgi:hypothetical protein